MTFLLTQIYILPAIKIFILITKLVISRLNPAFLRLAHQELQVHHRPEGARRRSRRDAEEAHLPPQGEGADRQPARGGAGQDAAGHLPPDPEADGSGPRRG